MKNSSNLLPFLAILVISTLVCTALAGAGIEVLTVSPRLIADDETGFLDQRTTGLSNVGLGDKCYLTVRPDNPDDQLTSIAWFFAGRPASSAAAFQFVDQAQTWFIPDRIGEYIVQVTAQSTLTGETMTFQRRILGAVFTGVGGRNNEAPQFPQCQLCHGAIVDRWETTRHAHVLENHLNGQRSDQYDPTCFECHTVGFNAQSVAANNGFSHTARILQADLNQLAGQVNEAFRRNQDANPGNDVLYYETLAPQLRAKANVQCENCHGPGSEHFGNPANIGKAWDARVCAQCHDAMGFDGYPYPFDSSSHKKLTASLQNNPGLFNSSCAKCHTAEGFYRLAVLNNPNILPDDNLEPHGVSCVACHDPHNLVHPMQLRLMGDIPLDSGHVYTEGGTGSLCAVCHQSRVSGSLESVIQTQNNAPHFGPQADVMMGINAWDFGTGFVNKTSVHKYVVQDTCVACHMARIPENGWSLERGILLGGHSFRVTNIGDAAGHAISNYQNSCLPCHLTMTSIDRRMSTSQDYDGNGKIEGIQTEVKGLLRIIAAQLQQRYPDIQVREDQELIIPSAVFNQASFLERAAIYNYRLVVRDGSFGIHNARFIVEILQKTYGALTQRSFNSDYPMAYAVGTSSVQGWSEY